MKVLVLQGQSIFDIAVIYLGSAEGAYALAAFNGISVTDVLIPGQELELPPVVSRSIAEYYSNKGSQPATASEQNTDEPLRVFPLEFPIEFS